MDQTLVAVFESNEHATRARDELLAAGFSYANVVVHSGADRTGSALDGQSTVQEDHGGIGGWFRSMFNLNDDDEQARLYAEAVRRGNHVVSVHVNDEQEAMRAQQILQRDGTVDLDERSTQWRAEGWTAGTATTGTSATSTTATSTAGLAASGDCATPAAGAQRVDSGTRTIPVVQEDLQVGKRAVQRGGVRVFARVVETPVQQTVNLREEHATIQRRAVDRPATEADLAAAVQSGTIEVRETAEEAVVAKTARVVEEIEVGKQVTEHAETVRDTVRRTDVQVEQLACGEHAMASPGTTDTTRTTGSTAASGTTRPAASGASGNNRPSVTKRASDAIERAIPGDSDRDGK